MQMNVEKALRANSALQKFNSQKLPIKLGLKLAANQRALEEVEREFSKRRQALLEQFGEKNDKSQMTVSAENLDAFSKELTAIADEEIELELLTIKLSELPPDHEVEPNALAALDWMIKVDQ